MRHLIFVSLFLLFIPLLCADLDKSLHTDCIYPSVRITCAAKGKGSGVVVRSEKFGEEYRNVVITCGHVCEEETNYGVDLPMYTDWSTFDSWKSYKAYVYAKNLTYDLAILLFISDEKLPTAKLDMKSKIYLGNDLMKIANGLGGDEPRLDYGKMTSLKHKLSDCTRHCYRTSITSVPGDSGSPVFYKNKVIGFTQAIRRMTLSGNPLLVFNISYVIPVNELEAWNTETGKNIVLFSYDYKKEMPQAPFDILKLEAMIRANDNASEKKK